MANPYPIDGTIYDLDGSTAVNQAQVVVLDSTSGERISMKTNSSGQFILDIANLASGYSNGDKLQITATYGSGSAIRSLSKRHTVDTGLGAYSVGSMVLHEGEEPFGTCTITFAGATSTTDQTVSWYDRNDNVVFKLSMLAKTTSTYPFGYLGQKMDGGFIRAFSSESTGVTKAVTIFK